MEQGEAIDSGVTSILSLGELIDRFKILVDHGTVNKKARVIWEDHNETGRMRHFFLLFSSLQAKGSVGS